ncbi:hypothetical protein DLAC_04836 [Tieghemostelium lacteum]|uniref:Uncharacterized protein n=1 Tax=Tieghemostelium lacteum TaxID=361077 RepID=A0A151ZIX2_TIELA|nr:hypothetical protein DLAC_04836 [Tieghemostelium lacteum]|eukprot:KYQ93948.1 hypothetical protein DLAC_04836 [Tieghemostelium lacteum]
MIVTNTSAILQSIPPSETFYKLHIATIEQLLEHQKFNQQLQNSSIYIFEFLIKNLPRQYQPNFYTKFCDQKKFKLMIDIYHDRFLIDYFKFGLEIYNEKKQCKYLLGFLNVLSSAQMVIASSENTISDVYRFVIGNLEKNSKYVCDLLIKFHGKFMNDTEYQSLVVQLLASKPTMTKLLLEYICKDINHKSLIQHIFKELFDVYEKEYQLQLINYCVESMGVKGYNEHYHWCFPKLVKMFIENQYENKELLTTKLILAGSLAIGLRVSNQHDKDKDDLRCYIHSEYCGNMFYTSYR